MLRNLEPVPPHRGPSPTVAVAVEGRTLGGRRIRISVARPGEATLLLFLSTRCDGCTPLWELVRDPSSNGLRDVCTVAVVEPAGWRQRVAVARVAARSGRRSVVRSAQAFADYRVHAPFFVLIDGDGPSVTVEGVAWGPDDVAGHVRAALEQIPRSKR